MSLPHQLSPALTPWLSALFQAQEMHLAVWAGLAGHSPARLVADHPEKPGAALLWVRGRMYLAGSPENPAFNAALRPYFEQVVYPQGRAQEMGAYVLHFTPGWESVIQDSLAAYDPIYGEHLYYEFNAPAKPAAGQTQLPPGFSLCPADQALVQRNDLEGLDWLLDEMCSERPSVEDFLQRSFGLCLLHEKRIIGWCLSEYNTGPRCEVGIAIDDAHQRRGLATLLGSAFIEQAQAQGIQRVGWHCWKSNQPSAATALRIGYQPAGDYPTYYALFNETMHLLEYGHACLRRKQYLEALQWTRRALQREDAPPWAWWNAAVACNLAGLAAGQDGPNPSSPASDAEVGSEMALTYLEQALARGFTERAWMQKSPHMQNLHDHPRWKALMDV